MYTFYFVFLSALALQANCIEKVMSPAEELVRQFFGSPTPSTTGGSSSGLSSSGGSPAPAATAGGSAPAGGAPVPQEHPPCWVDAADLTAKCTATTAADNVPLCLPSNTAGLPKGTCCLNSKDPRCTSASAYLPASQKLDCLPTSPVKGDCLALPPIAPPTTGGTTAGGTTGTVAFQPLSGSVSG